jgi:putative membrane protein
VLLTPQEADAVEARIAQVEARSGAEVVTAVVGRSDAYPELAWKAFALGAVVAALVVVALDYWRPEWAGEHATWFNVAPILAAGAASALLAIAVPEYGRLFLDRVRSAGEVRQYAQALFLERRLFRTRSRNGVLVLASLYERNVQIVADIGFDDRVDDGAWAGVIDAMTPMLAAARPAEALLRALDQIEAMLVAKGFAPDGTGGGELSNRPIDDAGAT